MYALIMHCKPACIHNAVDIYICDCGHTGAHSFLIALKVLYLY